MKISLERDALLGQLQTVSRVASTRSAIQALSGVQLVASASECELRATDMDVGLRVPLEAEVAREGVVVLPARLLLDVVRSLPAVPTTLELRPAEQDVELVSGNATFHIRTLRTEDFPPFPEPDQESTVSLPAEAFISTALKVAGSASRDETRPVLTVILVFAMLGVLIALGVGVATMLKGGNPRRSNKMMQVRVIMQAIALVTLAVLMMMAANR